MRRYIRPILHHAFPRPAASLSLAGGAAWFDQVVVHSREAAPHTAPIDVLTDGERTRLTAPRADVAGLAMDHPNVMGILNVTPDSFSDGGRDANATNAASRALGMVENGADIIDIGGESTRPGAAPVPFEAEIARTEPVIRALRAKSTVPISIDTRKHAVAEAAVAAGANLINDVSGFTYDAMLAPFCAQERLPVCVMHARGDPETMQDNPRYDDVLLDIYDFLEAQVIMLEGAGLPRDQIVLDPGIGFGKTVDHNLSLLNGLSLFHSLGCPLLLGASRKGFIGQIADAHPANNRMPGSVAVALAAVAQGVQIIRVHDVAETVQAVKLWQAVSKGTTGGDGK